MTAISITRSAGGLSWARLVRSTAVAQCVGLVAVAVVLGDAEAAGVAAATVVGLGLLRFRGGRIGVAFLTLVFLDVAFFTGAAALTNLADRAATPATIATAALAALAIPGLVASVATLARRERSSAASWLAGAVAVIAFVAFAAVAVTSLFTSAAAATAGPEVLWIRSSGMRFSARELVATSRTVTIRFSNRDLFWHTFTIDELGVDLKVPVGGDKEVRFEAAPGTYLYYCAVPGHASAGMRGTLTVR